MGASIDLAPAVGMDQSQGHPLPRSHTDGGVAGVQFLMQVEHVGSPTPSRAQPAPAEQPSFPPVP